MERLSLRDFARLFELEKIVVRNYKSLMDLELSLPTRVTVVAGPNGSGKTALVEALELLKDVQEWAKGRTANPFSKWWGYRNVVYRHDETRSITIGLKLKLNREKLEEKLAALNRDEKLGTISEKVYQPVRDFMERLDAALKLLSASELSVYYEASLKGLHRFSVEDEVFKLEAGLLSIDGSFARKKFFINVNFRELIKSENLIPAAMPIYRSILKTRLKTDVLNREEFYLWMLGIIESGIIESLCTEDWMSGILHLTIEYDELLFEMLVYPYYDGLRGVINWHDELVDIFEESISNAIDEALEKQREALISCLRSSTKLSELSKKIQNAEELILKALRILLEIVAYGLAVIIAGAAVGIWEFIEGIVVLRGVKFSELKTPQPLTREEALRSDGSNLAPYLYTITEGRVPREVEEALEYVLEGCGEVKLSMPVTDDGRVYISIQVDGVKLPPPSQPDGALKALLVEAALLSKPSMIAIDEFENSLHPLAQQFLIDEIRSSGAYAIITTHSPVVLDYLKRLDELVLLKWEKGGTRALRTKSPEELKNRLTELGLTTSEALLSGLLPEKLE
ncbi:MAG: AAA family ATPase [Thermofilaceae archaeon]